MKSCELGDDDDDIEHVNRFGFVGKRLMKIISEEKSRVVSTVFFGLPSWKYFSRPFLE